MLGRLGFDGPMMEAMGNMAPLENFLLLVGKVCSETGTAQALNCRQFLLQCIQCPRVPTFRPAAARCPRAAAR